MFEFLKSRVYPIGIDIGDDALRLVQLGSNGSGVILVAGGNENRPVDLKPGSGDWQRWVIGAIKTVMATGKFRGRGVIAAMPANDLFIDHIRMPKADGDKLRDAIMTKIKHKLPFEPGDAMVKYIPAGQDNVVVIAAQRGEIDKHLAIYEKANLQLKSISAWPMALTNSYVKFFGRRKTDVEAVVMLLDVEASCTKVVVCRHKNLLFACSVPIGVGQLEGTQQQGDETITRLVLELTGCKRHFGSMHRNTHIERLIFLSGQTVNKEVCTTIAKQLEMPAQMGNCLAAVEVPAQQDGSGIDRRESKFSWATAFGLSLS